MFHRVLVISLLLISAAFATKPELIVSSDPRVGEEAKVKLIMISPRHITSYGCVSYPDSTMLCNYFENTFNFKLELGGEYTVTIFGNDFETKIYKFKTRSK